MSGSNKQERFCRLIALPFFLIFLLYVIYSGATARSQSLAQGRISTTPTTTSTSTTTSSTTETEEATTTAAAQATVPTAPAAVPDHLPSFLSKLWRSAATDHDFSDDEKRWTRTWTDLNPYLRTELLTDQSGEAFIRSRYGRTRPDIVAVFTGLRIPILRADLLRYLVLLAEGGIWSDLDAECTLEIAKWNITEPKQVGAKGELTQGGGGGDDSSIDMIVGLEFDMDWRGVGQIASQFTNWVIAARPSSHHLQFVVDSVIGRLRQIAEDNKVDISGITLDMLSNVVDVTGPKMMTVSILKSLSVMMGHTVDDRHFHGIKSPQLIGDLLVLQGNAFASAQNGYPHDQGDQYIAHHYNGAWKKEADAARERRKKLEEAKKAGNGT